MTPDMVNVMSRIHELQQRFGLKRTAASESSGVGFKKMVTDQIDAIQTPLVQATQGVAPESSALTKSADELMMSALFESATSTGGSTTEDVSPSLTKLLKQNSARVDTIVKQYQKNSDLSKANQSEVESSVDLYAN